MAERPHKRRVLHDIVGEILQNAKDGARKTHIMYSSNLSFSQTERYLDALKKAGFITENSGIWKTTQKGLHVVEACEVCKRLLETV